MIVLLSALLLIAVAREAPFLGSSVSVKGEIDLEGLRMMLGTKA